MRWIAVGAVVLAGVVVSARPPIEEGGQARVEQIDGRHAAAGEVLVKLRGRRRHATSTRSPASPTPTPCERWAAPACGDSARACTHACVARRLLATIPPSSTPSPTTSSTRLSDPPDPLAPQLWGLQNVGQAVNSGLARPAGRRHPRRAGMGRLDRIDGARRRRHRHRHRLHAPRPRRQHLVRAGAVHGHRRRRDDDLPGRHPRLQRHRAHLRSDGRPQPRHARRRHHRRRGRQRHRRGRRELGHQLMGVKFLDADRQRHDRRRDQRARLRDADASRPLPPPAAPTCACSRTAGAGAASRRPCATRSPRRPTRTCCLSPPPATTASATTSCRTYPASYDVANIVAVAATTNTDGRACFSNYGAASVDLGAPGVDILSTTIGNVQLLERDVDGDAARFRCRGAGLSRCTSTPRR